MGNRFTNRIKNFNMPLLFLQSADGIKGRKSKSLKKSKTKEKSEMPQKLPLTLEKIKNKDTTRHTKLSEPKRRIIKKTSAALVKEKQIPKESNEPELKHRKQIGKAQKVKPVHKSKLSKKTPTNTKKPMKPLRIEKAQITRKPQKQLKEEGIPDELMWIKEDPHDQLLSRFVETPKGTRVGESIGIDKTRIILKNKLNFYSIPLNSIREKENKLVLRRKVNWDKAAKLGEIWRRNALDVIKEKKQKKSKRKKNK